MTRNKKRTIAAVGVIAALAAGGAAFTDSIPTSDTHNADTGYGSITVNANGQALESVVYGFNADGSDITSVHLTFQDALATTLNPNGQYVAVAFNDATNNAASPITSIDDWTCTDNTGGAALIKSKDATCTIKTGKVTPTADVANLDVLVTDNANLHAGAQG
jgi:hypothetical protein